MEHDTVGSDSRGGCLMGRFANAFGPEHPEATYVPHGFREQLCDTGEARLNYAVAGAPDRPALLLIPGQSESWWGYEQALPLLAQHFQAFAVDLRGQGRSTRTPGRYTLDNLGNDLVRFIELAIRRPTYVSGLSSGGVLSAWLSAYARPGQVRAACWEDPPLFASELHTSCGPSIHQSVGPLFALWSKYLGDQWSIGDWEGFVAAAPLELPPRLAGLARAFPAEPPQNLKEYDPEWARAFVGGTVAASCSHERMIASAKVPVLLTHHFRALDPATGGLLGALTDLQAARVRELVAAAGQRIDYKSFPTMGHSMHGQDPKLFSDTLVEWVASLG
jgi:pimeloyl-ACP methyl ester carboxylesterase